MHGRDNKEARKCEGCKNCTNWTHSQAGWRPGSRWLHRHMWWYRRLAEPLPQTIGGTSSKWRDTYTENASARLAEKHSNVNKQQRETQVDAHPEAAILGGLDEQIAILGHELGHKLPPNRSPADDALVGSLIKSMHNRGRGRKGPRLKGRFRTSRVGRSSPRLDAPRRAQSNHNPGGPFSDGPAASARTTGLARHVGVLRAAVMRGMTGCLRQAGGRHQTDAPILYSSTQDRSCMRQQSAAL